MAVFDASASDDILDMGDPTMVAVGGYIVQTANTLSYLATDGTTLVTLTGLFSYSGGVPISGSVSQIDIDSSNDADTDISITYAPAENPDVLDLIASANSFWQAALANADTIAPSTTPAPGFVNRNYLGDFVSIGGGQTVSGQDDVLTYGGGGGNFSFFGEGISNSGSVTAGNDTIAFVATQPMGTIFGDIQNNNFGATLNGGDDIITTTFVATINATGTSFTAYGDAFSTSGTLIGGNDNFNVFYSANATVFGDAAILAAGSLTGGADTIFGATAGSDTLYGDVRTISSGTTFTGGNDTISGNGGDDTIYGDYQFDLGGTIVSEGNDILSGGSGDDAIYGNGGNDIIDGGPDRDLLNGGTGIDTVTYASSFSGVTVSLAIGVFQNTVGAGSDILSNFENLTGSAFADNLTGDGNANTLGGSGGSDTLSGGDGNDSLYGTDATQTGDAGVSNYLWGGLGNDTLYGAEGVDVLVGEAGADTFFGGAGDDWMYVDEFDTSIAGGAGFDRILVNTMAATFTLNVTATGAESIYGGNEEDTFSAVGYNTTVWLQGGGGNDTLTGGNAVDVLAGNDGNDTINGGIAIDWLYGGSGSDTLNGGLHDDFLIGNVGGGGDGVLDTYVFEDNWGTDRIYDFDDSIDIIDMSAVTGLTSFGQLTISAADGGVNSSVTFGGDTIFVMNTTAAQLTAADFIL